MRFSERQRIGEDLWERWLSAHTGPAADLRADTRAHTAFLAGVSMGIAAAEEQLRENPMLITERMPDDDVQTLAERLRQKALRNLGRA